MNDDEQRRRERRAIVRRHHPDAGGDADALVAELEALDRRYDRPSPVVAESAGLVEPLMRRLRRVRRAARKQVREARAAVPRGWPGHRRYHDISPQAPTSPRPTTDPTRPPGDTP